MVAVGLVARLLSMSSCLLMLVLVTIVASAAAT